MNKGITVMVYSAADEKGIVPAIFKALPLPDKSQIPRIPTIHIDAATGNPRNNKTKNKPIMVHPIVKVPRFRLRIMKKTAVKNIIVVIKIAILIYR
jgi:hypothetical protein